MFKVINTSYNVGGGSYKLGARFWSYVLGLCHTSNPVTSNTLPVIGPPRDHATASYSLAGTEAQHPVVSKFFRITPNDRTKHN